jgi:hypothetical protein
VTPAHALCSPTPIYGMHCGNYPGRTDHDRKAANDARVQCRDPILAIVISAPGLS